MGRFVFVALVAVSLSGCAFILPAKHSKPDGSSKVRPSDCKDSQEWDGTQCRHKGEGSGARKHDD